MTTRKIFPTRVDGVTIPKRRPYAVGYLAAVGEVPGARSDFGSCIANASAYIVELDELLSREKNWLTPYDVLSERYFPLHDCEADALVEAVKRSRFIQSVSYHAPTRKYLIYFSSDEMRVGFNYLVSEKRSNFKTVLWVHK